jgi:hypothetical protein
VKVLVVVVAVVEAVSGREKGNKVEASDGGNWSVDGGPKPSTRPRRLNAECRTGLEERRRENLRWTG